MGLENGFEIKISKKEFYKTKTYGIKPFLADERYVCVINWCKRWSLRRRIMRTFDFKEDYRNYEFQILEEFIPLIIREINQYINNELYNDWCGDNVGYRFEKHQFKDIIKQLKKLRKWMKHNPHITVVFYDSY